jgi:hypothetical protein
MHCAGPVDDSGADQLLLQFLTDVWGRPLSCSVRVRGNGAYTKCVRGRRLT